MSNEEFALRLTKLRIQKGVSARDMSLSIGQNPGYINSIESGKAMPSLTVFFYICDYFELTPKEFFDSESQNPEKINRIIEYLKKMDDKQLESLENIAEQLTK